jgi:hypothetical protein
MTSLLSFTDDSDLDIGKMSSPAKGDKSFGSDSDDSGVCLTDEMSEEDVFKLSPLSAPRFEFDDCSDSEEEVRIQPRYDYLGCCY